MSIPSMLGATATAFLLAPLIAGCLIVWDTLSGRLRLPRLRLFGIALQYLFNDTVEILLSPLLWVAAGFGTRLDSPASVRRHARLQRWSIEILARRTEQLLGLRIEVVGDAALDPAPVIVLSRHASLLDASLPALLYSGLPQYSVRGVIMSEMLSDPGFDLLYGRLGSVFINRDRGVQARTAIRALGEGLDDTSVGVICPEGRLFDPAALERALARLTESDPDRAAGLRHLRHLLPPRPGGVLALLQGAPEADVIVVMHAGFESIPSIAELARHAPLESSIEVGIERFDRADLPTDERGITEWLDQVWLRGDEWVDQRLNA
ncbi:MAG: hypothetical protein H6517_00195 [Microthrixaceae bacterium]|nr:hypothetical protein [Microthrixaceae bacterium]